MVVTIERREDPGEEPTAVTVAVVPEESQGAAERVVGAVLLPFVEVDRLAGTGSLHRIAELTAATTRANRATPRTLRAAHRGSLTGQRSVASQT